MTNFEQRREKYFNMIKSKPEILDKIISDNNNSEKGQKSLEVLLTPRNERELDAAEILYSMTSDTIILVDKIYNDEIEEIPLEENKGINAYVRIIKELKEGKDEAKLYTDKTSPKEFAEILYGFIIGFVSNGEDIVEYIGTKSGFDMTDDFEQKQFSVYFDKARRIMDSKNASQKDLNECTDEEVANARLMAEEFHKCIEEGQKDLSKEDKIDRLANEITKQLIKTMNNTKKDS